MHFLIKKNIYTKFMNLTSGLDLFIQKKILEFSDILPSLNMTKFYKQEIIQVLTPT